ncbi:MAG: hypothetical protein ACU0CI_06275 [Shimia sp.]
MSDEWVIDVLHDLRTFARDNEMPRLGEYLDDAIVVAHTELVARNRSADKRIVGPDGQPEPRRTGTKL